MVARTTPIGVKLKPDAPKPECDHADSTRRLALIIRRGLLVIVRGIESEYGTTEDKKAA